MILVVADDLDPSIECVRDNDDVVVATPSSLSMAGWTLRSGAPPTVPEALGGAAVRAVLVRVVRIRAESLPHVHPEDRAYVAAEMTAFLTAFLAQWPARRVNPVTPGNLMGLARSPEGWLRAVAMDGLATCVDPPAAEGSSSAVVVGAKVFDYGPIVDREERAAITRRIAGAAGSRHLAVQFCVEHSTAVTGVSYQPRLDERLWLALKDELLRCEQGAVP
ncbi:MAG: hypothetical protein QOD07_2870 [Frankiaceae bacterium]|jgi:hypothetical protein|nr:hypothetical protein [Frankiaceae bacterium]